MVVKIVVNISRINDISQITVGIMPIIKAKIVIKVQGRNTTLASTFKFNWQYNLQ